ncbi:MAG: N-acetylneuraminate synthase family protein [Gemmatimonadaceae bacterium]
MSRKHTPRRLPAPFGVDDCIRHIIDDVMRIGDLDVGAGCPCFVIAEAGSNHDGRLAQAKSLIDVAAAAGASAVKFQTFKARHMYPRSAGSVEYLKELGIRDSIYDLVEGLEMPDEWIPELAGHCAERGILFLSTPFDEASADLLEPYVPAFKIASYELTHLPLIRHVARKGKPLLLSTGGGQMPEIAEAIAAARAEGNDRIVVLQCTAKYPAPLDVIDVRALDMMRNELGVPVGLSDHSAEPLAASLAAVAREACVIEKHFTLSRSLPGPDHSFALEPGELREMIRLVREVERALGEREKRVRDVERELVDYRRSIFTTRPVALGEPFGPHNIAVLRRAGLPDPGLAPSAFDQLFGKQAARALGADHLVARSDIRS